jgi:branched-chain amino acid transport system ATP-binding protein
MAMCESCTVYLSGEGPRYCIAGSNSSGKTALMRTLCGLLPRGAEDLFQAEDITHGRASSSGSGSGWCRRAGSSSATSVEDNLHLGALPKARAQWRARRVDVDLFRAAGTTSQSASTLSGGGQRMLAIARGLMAHPRLLLLDEPTLGRRCLSTGVRAAGQLSARALAVLLSERTRSSLAFAQQAYVVENGSVALQGPASALQQDSRIKQAYLGL